MNENLNELDTETIQAELESRVAELHCSKKVKTRGFANYKTRALHQELMSRQKVIYDVDDRKDLYEITNAKIKSQARSVAGIFDITRITDNNDGTSTLKTLPFKVAQNLCENETYGSQPTGPFCTAFLVADDIVATAGHCINRSNMARARFVFGFQMISKEQAKTRIKNEDIYKAAFIIDRKLENSNSDYALVKLDRPVTNRSILPIRREDKISVGDGVYVIGHPAGLPLKFADGARVLKNNVAEYFSANLDTYGGNSGSPVFNESTGLVEGVLVRGDTDFTNVGNCFVSNVLPTTGADGEDINRIADLASNIPLPKSGSHLSQDDQISAIEDKLHELLEELNRLKKP